MTRCRLMACAALLAVTAGCGTVDPFRQPGTWRPEAVNERNLAVSVVNPTDLLYGHGDPRPAPQMATNAVRRLVAGVPAPLPPLSADVTPGSGGSAAPAATPSAGAGASAPAAATGAN